MTIIIVDAGHGPNTLGKRSPDGKLREFTFNNAVAHELKQLLVRKHIQVVFTHESLRDVPLAERVRKANATGGKAFISIHANAFTSNWHAANGIETYVKKNATLGELNLATLVQKGLTKQTGLRNRGVKREDFYVLKHTVMPAILVECGFMTNRHEAKLLATTSYQKLCANSIAVDILKWLKQKN